MSVFREFLVPGIINFSKNMGLLIKISTIFALMTAIIVGYAKIKMVRLITP